MEFFFIILGFVGLYIGGELCIVHGERLARKIGASDEWIGLFVFAIGTSLPEIVTTIFAAFSTKGGEDASGIALGNIIGSNIVNLTVVLGILSFFVTLQITRRLVFKDGFVMIFAMVLVFFLSVDGGVSRFDGAVLLTVYISYLLVSFFSEKKKQIEEDFPIPDSSKKDHLIQSISFTHILFFLFLGLGVLLWSAHLIVSQGVFIARSFGIDEVIIGILVGLGTSLPELTISLAAIKKGNTGLSVGNVIGSNITNPLFALGIGSLFSPFFVESRIILFDIPFLFFITVASLLLLYENKNLTSREGGILIGFFLLYLVLNVTMGLVVAN